MLACMKYLMFLNCPVIWLSSKYRGSQYWYLTILPYNVSVESLLFVVTKLPWPQDTKHTWSRSSHNSYFFLFPYSKLKSLECQREVISVSHLVLVKFYLPWFRPVLWRALVFNNGWSLCFHILLDKNTAKVW